ncbi:MAG: hypothetical protein Ta2B_30810 [Termitinemataceae bacterium]|nr:MAG: hypothetical protein Ta2B_30810 [Termitinemataceae bacterium]
MIIYLLYYQQTDLVKSFLDNDDIAKLLLPFNGRRDSNIIAEFKTGYYYINLDISGLQYANKDAVFFYAGKFAQYLNHADFQSSYNSNNAYTIKNSEAIARELKYPDYTTFLNELTTLLGEQQNGRRRNY